jgi:uncharacterized protein (TIGR00369 family)
MKPESPQASTDGVAVTAHWRRLERMYADAPITRWFGSTLAIVKPEFFHGAGAVHGSVYFRALDDAAFFAVSARVMDVFILTASFHIDLVRPVSAGVPHAEGRVVHSSSRLHLAEATLTGDDGKLLARGHGSFMRSEMRLADFPTYG